MGQSPYVIGMSDWDNRPTIGDPNSNGARTAFGAANNQGDVMRYVTNDLLGICRRLMAVGAVSSLVFCGGCGPSGTYEAAYPASVADSAQSFERAAAAGDQAVSLVAQAGVAGPTSNRKIVYDGSLWVNVDDLKTFENKLRERLQKVGGFVADFRQTASSGSTNSLYWRLRIPVDQFDGFLADIESIGSVYDRKLSSNDVTAQFVDLESRLRNKKATEERLLDHLKTRDGEVDEIIGVERELDRVREQIEQMEGQLRVLADLTSLATIEVHAATQVVYQPEVKPSFAVTLRETFGGSVATILAFLKACVVAVVATIPWLPLILPPAFIGYRVLRPRRATGGQRP